MKSVLGKKLSFVYLIKNLTRGGVNEGKII
jgi:hypothetical protein